MLIKSGRRNDAEEWGWMRHVVVRFTALENVTYKLSFSLQDCKSHDWAASDCIWFLICFASCVFLQFNKLSLENANPRGHPTRKQFVAGDVRINEAIGLVTLATLFLREHNYQARLYRIQQRRMRRYVSSNEFGIVDHRSFFFFFFTAEAKLDVVSVGKIKVSFSYLNPDRVISVSSANKSGSFCLSLACCAHMCRGWGGRLGWGACLHERGCVHVFRKHLNSIVVEYCTK